MPRFSFAFFANPLSRSYDPRVPMSVLRPCHLPRGGARLGGGRREHPCGRVLAAILIASGLASLGAGGSGCANPPATVVILQIQKPKIDADTHACVVGTDLQDPRLDGVFDVDLDRDYPYYVYPLVQNRLPSLQTSGGVQRNAVSLTAIRVDIKPPAGVNADWAAGCPGTFDSPASVMIDPNQTQALAVRGFLPCHARRLRELIAQMAIPADNSQPVFFTLDLKAVASHNGDSVESDPFQFQVSVCAGCLQSMFPLTPACIDAPKPNPRPGNLCNIAQDGPQVLCCLDSQGGLVCPAPDA